MIRGSLSFKGLTANTVATAEQVHDFLNLPFTAKAKEKLEEWDRNNPRYKHGKNSYSLEKYGLTEAMVNEIYQHYRDRFAAYL